MSDTPRENIIHDFLAQNGLAGADEKPLAGDASFRSYRRISFNGQTFVLMDAPPSREDVAPFMALSSHLIGIGFSAPKVLAAEPENGLLLLEDLGDDTFSRVLIGDAGVKTTLYEAAVDGLVALQEHEPADEIPVYSPALLFEELFLFTHWYLPALLNKNEPVWEKDLTTICAPLFESLQADTNVLTLRDYHADNLIWLPAREGVKKVGLLDFQDGVIGHRAYDLVSLLQDARQPFDRTLEQAMIKRYLLKAGAQIERESFIAAYQVLGAQRNIKIIGIFTRLWKRDRKSQYPGMIPHVWGLLEENLHHPALSALKEWLDATVLAELRTKTLT